MIAVLGWLWFNTPAVAGLLSMVGVIGHPRRLTCDCHAPGFAQRHLKRPLMLAVGGLYALATARALRNIMFFPEATWKLFYVVFGVIFVAGAVFNLNQWRKHPKDKNRHPLGRMLAVVRETAAGLRIVPIPAGGRA